MWRSVGFLMSFAVVLEGMTIVSYIIILAGGKQLRESGWSVLSLLLILVAGVQAAGMSIVVSTGRHGIDRRHHQYWDMRANTSIGVLVR